MARADPVLGAVSPWASSPELPTDANCCVLCALPTDLESQGSGPDHRQPARGSRVCRPPWGRSWWGASAGTPAGAQEPICPSWSIHTTFWLLGTTHDGPRPPPALVAPAAVPASGRARRPLSAKLPVHTEPNTGGGQDAMLGRTAVAVLQGRTQRPRKVTDMRSVKGRCFLCI